MLSSIGKSILESGLKLALRIQSKPIHTQFKLGTNPHVRSFSMIKENVGDSLRSLAIDRVIILENSLKNAIVTGDVTSAKTHIHSLAKSGIRIFGSNIELAVRMNQTEIFTLMRSYSHDFYNTAAKKHLLKVMPDGLIIAAENDNYDIMNGLLSGGFDPNIEGSKPIIIASRKGNLRMVKLLFKHRSEINLEALVSSVKNNHISIVKYLIKKAVFSSECRSKAFRTGVEFNRVEIVEYLIRMRFYGAGSVNTSLGILILGVVHGFSDISKLMLESLIDNEKACDSALFYGSLNNQMTIVEHLIENYPKCADNSSNVTRSINAAAEFGHLEMVKYLIENTKSFDKNAIDLSVPAKKGHLKIVEYLFDSGVDSDAQVMEAIMAAADANQSDIADLLCTKKHIM